MRLVEPRFPVDVHRLKIAPTLRHAVAFRPEGIRFTGLIYQNDRLMKLRKNLGATAKIEFRYDPRDMSRAYVLDPVERQLFLVPSAQPEYTQGLTLYQHRLIRKMARLRRKLNPSIPDLLQTREELRQLVAQTLFSPKKRERAFSKSVGVLPGGAASTSTTSRPPTQVMTDLEAQVADIDDVEMETSEDGWDVPELI
jgi:putative transposase